jgi:hypothetical protein
MARDFFQGSPDTSFLDFRQDGCPLRAQGGGKIAASGAARSSSRLRDTIRWAGKDEAWPVRG